MFENNRILIVDDNESIHDDFRKILLSAKTTEENEYKNLELELFGNINNTTLVSTSLDYQIDFVFQGEQALELVEKAEQQNKPYALIFMDVRMPPGWDGIETISKIWEQFPNIEIVICSAYSDYSWDKIISKLGPNDRLLFLKKPFDAVEVQQMALALVKKWNLAEKAKHYVDDLEREVAKRTKQLKSMVQELINSRDKLKQEIFIRRQAELALASEKENLTVTLRSIRDAVITINVGGTITLVNKVAEEILGIEMKGLLGKSLGEVLYLSGEKNKEKLNVGMEHTLQEGKIIEYDDDRCILIARNKKEIPVSINCSSIIDKNNKISGIVVVIRDISEKQKNGAEPLGERNTDSERTTVEGDNQDTYNLKTSKAERIIVVDDQEMVRNVLKKILEEIGYQVEIANNSAKVLEIYQNSDPGKNNFSVLIIDLKVINSSGNKETMEKLKQIAPDLKIVISGSYSHDPVILNYRDYGFDGIINKPFRVNELRDLLDRIINI